MVSLNDSSCSVFYCRKLKRGDTREDGYRFNKYLKKKNRDGSTTIREVWLSPTAWENELKNAAIRCREYRLKNKDNPDYISRKRASDAKARNTDVAKQRQSEYFKNYYKSSENVERRREYKRRYLDKKTNHLNRLKHNIGTLIRISIKAKGFSKDTKTEEILGCSWSFFKSYIEARFQEGQGWHNRELWDIDHIIPMKSAKTKKEVIALNHYSNLRPLWRKENRAKWYNPIQEQLTLI
jgi:hypothetical protein